MSEEKRDCDKENEKKESLFKAVRVFLPLSIVKTLEDISISRKIPSSRLIAIAVANELDTLKPFTYELELPKKTDAKFTSMAGKIYKYLKLCTYGMDAKLLLIARNDMGIEDKDDFLKALKLLFDEEMIVEVNHKPRWSSYSEKRIMSREKYEKAKRKSRLKGEDEFK